MARWGATDINDDDPISRITLEKIIEEPPSNQDVLKENEKYGFRMSTSKKESVHLIYEMYSRANYKKSFSSVLRAMIKCGVLRMEKNLSPIVGALYSMRLKNSAILQRNPEFFRGVPDVSRDLYSCFRYLGKEKPISVYMYWWCLPALERISNVIGLGTLGQALEIAISEALVSSERVVDNVSKQSYIAELAYLDNHIASVASSELRVSIKMHEIGLDKDIKLENDIKDMLEVATWDGTKYTFSQKSFYRW